MNTDNRKLYRTIANSQVVRRKFITKYTSLSGAVSSMKNQKHIWFESSLEKDFALMLEYHPSVKVYIEQPITIEYNLDDKTRVYTPDFLIHFNEDSVKPWLCEIKYRDDLTINFSKYKARFKAAKRYCDEQGWEFKIISEFDIRTDLLDNLKFLSKYDLEFVEEGCLTLITERVQNLGHTTVR
ncbi:MAG: Tn7 transposase TnsA N-terminal domain-containing protein, partial [Flavobacteriia bacterium]|nr:Tn7 transposase TnsA N-terminal domain-containing protein [Flavobacteriia bacterium]